MAQIQTSGADGLPKHFVAAMRTLFDIMDDQNTGFVKFSDIEGRWQDDGTQGLPKGVLESLKKVTPSNGLLSFERFCTGLKICLLQIQTESDPKKHDGQPNRPPSAPILIPDSQSKTTWISPNTATIRPNNAMSQQRTLSMPQLLAGRKDGGSQLESMDNRIGAESKLNKVYGPPKPPRTGAALEARTINLDRNFDKSEIRTVLQNWQMGLLMNDDKTVDKRQLPAVNYRTDTRTLLRPTRVLGDGKAVDLQNNQVGLQSKKTLNRRREPRRHTLQNGIDYNMMKRMKQIEQEKDVLLQGLTAVDKAREWYLKQISATQEKIKHLGRMGSHVEQWTEAQQERLELQRARVLEVNRHLAALISSWERGGLPLHMNLAFLSTPTSTQLQQDMLSRLKQQNHRLTEEVSKKSQRIAILEQEKDNLVRELYNRQSGMVQSRRATMIHEQHDQTFM
ncbi:suppressor APC domain-containing protein 2 isoform X2 [Hylaeus anthracinus]|uniref:suppressor APC domain-containing protein 2 isoform X2 n=1 Tax=Hylaeus volcanicus TaxID=313075 RepID=UPI0023B7B0F5|nr:suppressor APC domain-containing protein 2 isoform X2 [Hylaeus volcanicus]XP_054013573.1 suppressor APC domain-containing protein 2 isoform X2 [Hylaeus anthracinus]